MQDPDLALSPESESGPAVSILGSREFAEFVRYFTASLLALVVDVGILTLLTTGFGVDYLISGVVAFIVGLIIVYILSVVWVFNVRGSRSRTSEFMIFSVVGVIGLGINEAVLWILTGYFGLFYLISKGMSVFIVFTWNYFARKWLLFR